MSFIDTPLENAREAFERNAQYPAEAVDDGNALEAHGRHLGAFVRELMKDVNRRSNLDGKFITHPEDLVNALCDACSFDDRIMRDAALEELGK